MKEFLESNDMMFLALAFLQVTDVVTGILSVRKRGAFDTKKLSGGTAKKIFDWFFVAIAFLSSHILVRLGEVLEMDFSLSKTLGWVVLASLLYKECRSMFDNLQSLGVAIPQPLVSVLLLAEKEFDGVLILPEAGDAGMNLKLNKPLDKLGEADTIQVKVQKAH